MQKIIIFLIVLAVIGIGAYYLVSKNNSGGALPAINSSATPTPIVSAIVSKTPTAASVTVEIKNFSFSPSTLNIKTGTKVTWINNDSVPHTVTSDAGNLLNSPTLSPGQSFGFTFTEHGSVNYHCGIHPTMKGGIIINQ